MRIYFERVFIRDITALSGTRIVFYLQVWYIFVVKAVVFVDNHRFHSEPIDVNQVEIEIVLTDMGDQACKPLKQIVFGTFEYFVQTHPSTIGDLTAARVYFVCEWFETAYNVEVRPVVGAWIVVLLAKCDY
jgi:hypothetical protein